MVKKGHRSAVTVLRQLGSSLWPLRAKLEGQKKMMLGNWVQFFPALGHAKNPEQIQANLSLRRLEQSV